MPCQKPSWSLSCHVSDLLPQSVYLCHKLPSLSFQSTAIKVSSCVLCRLLSQSVHSCHVSYRHCQSSPSVSCQLLSQSVHSCHVSYRHCQSSLSVSCQLLAQSVHPCHVSIRHSQSIRVKSVTSTSTVGKPIDNRLTTDVSIY